MLTAAFDLKIMSHWVLWSAHYGVIDGCQSGSLWQIAMGGGEQMPADFRGLAEPGTEAHVGKQKQMGGLWLRLTILLRLRVKEGSLPGGCVTSACSSTASSAAPGRHG